ncbi:methyltransferase domain-containing protein [Streptomyces sp. NPDC048550]|uniref:class I SAM-dependent methyltransferase n=1 Tax=Streptomyces sp. NPDC048550 TaxID=3155739 RepID=UPI003447DF2D
MTPHPTTGEYSDSSLSHATASEQRRLRVLQDLWGPFSRRHLSRLDIQPHWSCLELGAGAGFMARWLAEQVPDGTVVAADLDIRMLQATPGNLRAVQHDVRHDDFPRASFDLIYARVLFEHLPDRERILSKVTEWLRPGGHLVIEGIDITPGTHSPHPALRKMTTALTQILTDEIGTDFGFIRTLPRWLALNGFPEATADFTTMTVGDGGAGEAFFLSNLEQLTPALTHRKLLTSAEVSDFHAWLAQPGAVDVAALMSCVHATTAPGSNML